MATSTVSIPGLGRMVLVGALALAIPSTAHLAGQRAKSDRATVVHVLNRATFGPRETDIARVSQIGVEAYIDEQLHPDRIDDGALDTVLADFETLTLSTAELSEKYFEPAQRLQRQRQAAQAQAPGRGQAAGSMAGEGMMAPQSAPPPTPQTQPSPEEQRVQQAQRNVVNELMQAKMVRAVLSERQLQEVLTDFWFNHFNVFVGKGQVRQYLTEYERDVIRPNVLGSFRTLLGKVAHSPAMLFYLDNWQSSAPADQMTIDPQVEQRLRDGRLTPQQRQRLEERLRQMQAARPRQSRGLNENYARELMELHTLGVDGGYTQKDVVELARILTGWTIDRPQQGGSFVFRPAMHDNGTKTLLGVTFASTGEGEGERALDLLANHPSTARHIALKLTQRFVADEPPTALVDRVAKTFRDTKGDLRAVVRSILTSKEFLGADFRRAKVKTPLEFVASAARATDATIVNSQPLVTALQNLGMPLYGCQPPTGYDMTADTWVNTGSLLARMNFAVQIVSNGRVQPQQAGGRGIAPAPNPNAAERRGAAGRGALLRGPIRIDVRRLAPDSSEAVRTALVARLLDGHASDATRQTLARATTSEQLVALTLGSPEFQRR
jgi:uncharacterized protein (DUF1800 family)